MVPRQPSRAIGGSSSGGGASEGGLTVPGKVAILRPSWLGQVFLYLESCLVPATIITLQCGECRERNYTTVKNKRNDPDRVELRKYCRRCRRHTVHRETK